MVSSSIIFSTFMHSLSSVAYLLLSKGLILTKWEMEWDAYYIDNFRQNSVSKVSPNCSNIPRTIQLVLLTCTLRSMCLVGSSAAIESIILELESTFALGRSLASGGLCGDSADSELPQRV
jgi:hypothetical protein